jgi:hypothetical protein
VLCRSDVVRVRDLHIHQVRSGRVGTCAAGRARLCRR